MREFVEHHAARSPTYIAANNSRSFGRAEVDELVQRARAAGVARVLLHRSIDERLHSMLVAQCSRTYWQPKRHKTKAKSFHIVRGSMLVAMFDELGNVTYFEVLECEDRLSVLVPEGMFHTNIALTEVAVHHEVIQGPFAPDEADRELASFAPSGSDSVDSAAFVTELLARTVDKP